MIETDCRVLVAYASRHGATAGIAEAIGDILRRSGVAVDVRRVRDVRDLDSYTAVVLGSAVYFERWQPDATAFVRRHRAALGNRRVWLFSSGPVDASADEEELPMTVPVAAATAGVPAREHRTFGGRLLRDTPSVVSGLAVEGGFEADFRNFERIRDWAREIAAEVRAATVSQAAVDGRGFAREPVAQSA